MRGIVARMVVVVAVLAWLVQPGAAPAADLGIEAFYGHWKGTGVAQSPNSLYFAMTDRDLDVKIGPKDAGFSVAWTTVLRQGGDPENPDVRRKSSALDFLPSGKPGVFAAAEAGDPLSGEAFAWARVKGQTLTVYLLSIGADGAYVVQSYGRTLTGFGMDLTFTNIRDDEPQRSVKGKLIRVQD